MSWEFTYDDIIKCPICKKPIEVKYGGILVNCESEQKVKIPNLLEIIELCENPFCEWSKVQLE